MFKHSGHRVGKIFVVWVSFLGEISKYLNHTDLRSQVITGVVSVPCECLADHLIFGQIPNQADVTLHCRLDTIG